MAVRLSTKIWHGTALLVLLVCDRTWCDLCRGGPRPSHTARLARRAPPAKQGGPRPTNPARRPRRGLQPPLQLVRQVPLPGVIKTISNGQTLVQLLWRVRGAQQLSPFTGILLQAPRASRLQEGSEVWVHVLPIGDRLTLRLVGDDAPPGQSAFFRQLSGPKKAGAADKSQVEWSPKQGLKDSLNWMDAEPLPHCLNGAAAPHLQGKVTRVDPSMAIVRLFWEAPPGLSDPELSPIAAALPVEALQKFFALTTVPLCSDYLQEGQLVSVQLQDPDDSEDLTVSLSPLQPMPPRPPPPCAGAAVSMAWQPLCGSNAPCRVIDATEAAWRRTPGDATSAMEEFGFSELWKLKTTNTLATLAFAVSETKQDVVITGAIPRVERMALLALLVAQHLVEAAPQELVLLLAPYGDVRLQSLEQSGKDEGLRKHLAKVRAQTLAGSPHEVLQKLLRPGQRDARTVSLVVVEGLPTDATEKRALKKLLSLLPSQRRWGPTILWHREPLTGELQVMEAALTASPARLKISNALHGAQEQVKLVPESLAAAAKLVAQRLARRQSVAIFTTRPQKMMTEIEKLVPDERLERARLRIMNAALYKWRESDGIFDVVIHVDPPPNPSEYFSRLGSCKQLAIVFMDVTKYRYGVEGERGVERLENEWVEFAFYAMDPATGEDAHRLRQLCRGEHYEKTRLSLSFQKDFHAEDDKELIWTAGVAETDTGLIFDAGL